MGNRVTVSISNSRSYGEAPVNVYAHWLGEDVYPIVHDLLRTTSRVGDHAYLTAQIIHAIISSNPNYDGTGFGVFAGPFDSSWDDNKPMFVDTDTGTYTIGYDGDEVNPNE